MHPITTQSQKISFTEHQCVYHRPAKKGRSDEASQPLAAVKTFQEGLEVIQDGFNRKNLAIETALDYLKKQFHELVVGNKKFKLQSIHTVVLSNCARCARRIQQFIDKDKHFVFAWLPRDIRKIIISYLGSVHWYTTQDFFKGDRNVLNLDWLYLKNVSHPIKDYSTLIRDYGDEIQSLSINNEFNQDSYPEEGLKGLRFLTLNGLDLNGHQLVRIIARLNTEKLETLEIKRCHSNDIDVIPLQELSSLRTLTTVRQLSVSFIPYKLRMQTLFFEQIGKLVSLNSLRLETTNSWHYPAPNFSSLRCLTLLTDLTLHFYRADHLENIGYLTNLKKIRLKFSIGELGSLSCLTKLETVKLSKSYITEIIPLDCMNGLSRLKRLIITDCTLPSLTLLTAHTGLQSLKLKKCSLGGSPIDSIARISNLTKLSLRYCHLQLSNRDFANLKALTQLRSLDLSFNNAIRTDGLTILSKKLNFLEKLNCVKLGIRESAFQNLTSLRELDISENDLSRWDGKYLSQLTNLTDLTAIETYIKVPVATVLAQLPKLEWIKLRIWTSEFKEYEPVEKLFKSRFIEKEDVYNAANHLS